MTIELLLLLLPVAAASGWLASRRNCLKEREQQEVSFEPVHLKGLNYLLNEQPDKAIDLFVGMLEVDSDTVETHLALGNLFRRRGEVERAIRIHQNLIARPTLKPNQRSQALLELGVDYMRAGLFDRAENLFIELKDLNHHAVQALTHLLTIYQNEKEWERCLETAQELEDSHKHSYQPQISHYYCELAETALAKNDQATALRLLKKAHSSDKKFIRAVLLQGRIETEQAHYKAAIKQYKKIARQQPSYISEILSSLIHCHQKLGWQKEMAHFLQQHYQQHKDVAVMTAITELIKAERGEKEATAFVLAHLQYHPDLHGLKQLITLSLDGEGQLNMQTLQVLQDLVAKMLLNRPAYRCTQCGFEATKLHWQCPSCHTWDGIKPVAALV